MVNKTMCTAPWLLAALLGTSSALADPPFRDVLFDIPLNLTDLPAIISKVAVECEVTISNVVPVTSNDVLFRTGRAEVDVVGGAVNQTLQVLVTLPSITRLIAPGATPVSRYTCKLRGFLDEGLGWSDFSGLSGLNPGNSVLALRYPNPIQFPQSTQRSFISAPIPWPTSP